MTLEHLLVTDFVKCSDPQNYKSFKPTTAPTERTKSSVFDLKDKHDPFIVEEGQGSVTYKNPLEKEMCITNYEEFINSLPNNLQVGIKRCDFLIYQDTQSTSVSFFILNELSQSHNIDDKESRALYQLQDTLERLCKVPAIKEKMDECSKKLCVFSNRVKPTDAPLGMTKGFNDTFMTMIQTVAPFHYDGINKWGFDYFRANHIEVSDTVLVKNSLF